MIEGKVKWFNDFNFAIILQCTDASNFALP